MVNKKTIYAIILTVILIGLYFLARATPEEGLKNLGEKLPLPIFTIIIGLLDGINPCSIMVMTILLGMIMIVSNSRKKIYAVGYTYVLTTFIIYYLFLVAWLNIFKIIGFTNTLRYIIAGIAIIAGIINIKEMFWYRKGVTLMIQESQKKPLMKRIDRFREIITNGTTPALILSAITLAVFTSMIEIPCTIGFPLIYAGILSAKAITGFGNYTYLLLYGIMYIMPLIIIITAYGMMMKGKVIKKETMQIIKYVGGIIMMIIGIILLINPGILLG